MTVWGLAGHKKVKDILIDEKVPHRVRRRMPVICAGETILWLPGVRRSAEAPVTAATRRFLYMEVENDA
ncbi:tRNA lysidine(34) synthetase TilS [Calditerricola satsumensis]|nr:tRNA lysidine(34) synthetase TilS [Calditerricola satsumensis]